MNDFFFNDFNNKETGMAKTKGIETKKGGINWARKLTSRKFWLSLASFVSMMSVALGENQEQATQLTALVMAGGAVVTYVLGEGMSDASGASKNYQQD